jgi:hypothetical protein
MREEKSKQERKENGLGPERKKEREEKKKRKEKENKIGLVDFDQVQGPSPLPNLLRTPSKAQWPKCKPNPYWVPKNPKPN